MKDAIGTAFSTLYKVSTQADGGLRITLDLPSTESELASKLLTKIAQNEPNVIVVFVEQESS